MTSKKLTKKPRKKAVNGRNKGSNQERKLAKLLTEWWGAKCYRTPGSGAWATSQTNGKLNSAGDIVCEDPDFPFATESKKAEGWHLEQLLFAPKSQIFQWWEQTVNQCPDDKIPMLVFCRNGVPEICAFWSGGEPEELMWYPHLTLFKDIKEGYTLVMYRLSDLLKTDASKVKTEYTTLKKGKSNG